MESFFFTCSGYQNENDIIDLLLSRYSNIEIILEMEVTDFLSFLKKAIEKQNEERIWDLYKVEYAHFDKKTFVTFEEYKAKHTGANIDKRSVHDLIAEIDKAHKKKESD